MPPVCGPHVNQFSRFGFDPTSTYAAAWKNKRVRSIKVNNRQLKVRQKRRRFRRDRTPFLACLKLRHHKCNVAMSGRLALTCVKVDPAFKWGLALVSCTGSVSQTDRIP